MIYLFNDVKKLTGTVKTNHYRTLLHEREKNGLYTTSVEVPVTYNDKGTIYNYDKKIRDNDFIGYYDKEGRFQLHKIAAYDIEDNFIKIKGIHVFFDEAKAGAIIKDRRFIDREVVDGAIAAFDTIGWQVVDYDVSVRKNYNFYNVSPLEALAILQETFEFEFDYWLTFDGKKVTGKSIAVKEKLGKKRPDKRYVYGHNVLSIRAEQDYSEVYTAVIGRGKGEEITETGGYGRRIEFTDVVWGDNKPLRKPAGSRMLEDKNATRLFGYKENGVVKPRIKVEVFSDIESPTELLQASYEWLMANNTPKAVFSLKVPDGDGLDLGDEVYVIYRDIDLVKTARVEKVIDDLKSGRRDVEFGDTAYFNVNRRMKSIENNLKRVGNEQGGAIYNLKKQFDERFNQMVSDYRDEFEQAKIDILAEVEADRARMEAEFNQAINDWTDAFNADVEQAYKDAKENYARIEQEITTAVDTTRNELEQGYTDAVEQAKRYAEEQSKAHADAVESKLDSITGTHQDLIDSLQNDVTDIDTFLGNRTEPLEQTLQNMKLEWEQKLDNVDTWHYNMLRGTRFDEGFWDTSGGQIKTDDEINYFEADPNLSLNIRSVKSHQDLLFEEGQSYTLSFDVQTYAHRSIDYIWIIASDGSSNISLSNIAYEQTAKVINWGREYGRYWLKFTMQRTMTGQILIGADSRNNELGAQSFKIRLPYLTTTDNTRWLYHQLDQAQNLKEITRRVMQLEDGYEEFVTKTQYNFDTGELDGRIKHVTSTVDGFEQTISNHENWILTNGASIEHTVDGFESKAWLSDIDNPNIIPHASVQLNNHRLQWDRGLASATGQSYQDWMQVTHATSPRIYLAVYSPEFSTVEGETYTLSFESWENGNDSSNTTGNMDYTFLTYRDSTNQSIWTSLKRKELGTINGATIYGNEVTFTANATSDTARMLIGTRVVNTGQRSTFRFRNPKLEVGSRATPFNNSFTGITQRADELYLMYQGLGEEGFITQSQVKVDGKGVQIGSTYVDGSAIGSILAVSPSGIDAVAKQMRLTGDLLVQGDVTALAVEAIEGRFSSLFANHLTANIIKGTHIDSKTITSDHIVVNDVLVNLIVARSVFADDITSKIGNFIDINAGRVRTAILESNVITADHLAVGTVMVDKIFGTSGRIDQLITKDHFVRNMKALSIEAVDAQFSSLLTKHMKAGYIDVDWIDGKNAWFERMYVNNAMISKLTSQSVFARDVRAISIDAIELNLTTIMNSMGKVEGGLSIRRPDGAYFIEQGIPKFGNPIITKPWPDTEGVEWDGRNYTTSSRGTKTFERAYCDHSGRYAIFEFQPNMRWDSRHASTYMGIAVRPATVPSGVSLDTVYTKEFIVYRDSPNSVIRFDVPLPRPTYGALSFILEFYRIGDNVSNYVQVRSNRCRISG